MGKDMRDTPQMGDVHEKGVAYEAGASAPPAPSETDTVFGDREVGIGAQIGRAHV